MRQPGEKRPLPKIGAEIGGWWLVINSFFGFRISAQSQQGAVQAREAADKIMADKIHCASAPDGMIMCGYSPAVPGVHGPDQWAIDYLRHSADLSTRNGVLLALGSIATLVIGAAFVSRSRQ